MRGNRGNTARRPSEPTPIVSNSSDSARISFLASWRAKMHEARNSSAAECEQFVSGHDGQPAHLKKRASKSMSSTQRPQRKPSWVGQLRDRLSQVGASRASLHNPRKQSAPASAMGVWQQTSTLHRNRSASQGNILTGTFKAVHNVFAQNDEGKSALDVSPIDDPSEQWDPHQRGGAAARAAAASANQNKARSRSTGQPTNDTSSSLHMLDSGNESGISLLPQSPDESPDAEDLLEYDERPSSSPNKDGEHDPISKLPSELVLQVLSYLDEQSLESASRISPKWALAARDPQVWKRPFLDKFGGQWPPTSHPLPVGGHGIGKGVRSGQDWRKLYKARAIIDNNWRTATKPQHFDNQLKCHTVHLFGHTDSVYCVQFDEHKIVTGSRDRTIRVWDIETYKCLKIIGCPGAIEHERRAAQHNQRVPMQRGQPSTANCTEANEVPDDDVWHIPRDYHTASILCMQYDSEIAVTGSSDSTVIVWDIKTWEPIRRFRRHKHGVLDLAFDSEKIVSCSKDYTLCVWDRKTGDLLAQLTGHQGPVNAVQLRGNLLVSASGEGTATLWNLNFERAPTDDHGMAGNAKVSPAVVRHFSSRDRGLACVEFSDDAKYILAGGNDQVIFKYDASTGSCIEEIQGHTQLVRSLYLDGINRRVISGSYDMSVRVWDWVTGEEVCHFPQWATSWILSAKSDYRRIVSTSQDGRVMIFDFGHGVRDVELLKGSPLRG